MAFKAGRWELPMVLGLVVLDGLNPVVRIYAWRILLGRNGIINGSLEWAGIIDKPIDALLFNNFAVIVVLSTSWITYTVIPIYASMKAIDHSLIEASTDLGAGWLRRFWKIILPLSAPGIFIAIILVYIPLYTEFATPTLVGGTGSYMLGQLNAELITETGDLGQGAALSALLLAASGVLAAVAYYLSRLNRLDT
jgi:spermidine/putrescine transport system permease protein